MRLAARWAVAALGVLAGCRGTGADGHPDSARDADGPLAPASGAARQEGEMTGLRSEPATDDKLEIVLELEPGVKLDRIPMRSAVLHFRNRSTEPLRIYLPRGEAFRTNISTLVFRPQGESVLLVPAPQPHGYVVAEEDFHLLAPGESRAFVQPFTLDPFVPGPGNRSERRAGFAAGSEVTIDWIYENQIDRWEGGRLTLDGPTKTLFGGERIPNIWLGKLKVRMRWRVPD